MPTQFRIPTFVLYILNDVVFVCAFLLVGIYAVGFPVFINVLQGYLLCVLQLFNLHPSHGFTFPCRIGRGAPPIGSIFAVVHQAPCLHSLIVVPCTGKSRVEVGQTHAMTKLMTEQAYARNPFLFRAFLVANQFVADARSIHCLAIYFKRRIDGSSFWPHRFVLRVHVLAISSVYNVHQVYIAIVVGIVCREVK